MTTSPGVVLSIRPYGERPTFRSSAKNRMGGKRFRKPENSNPYLIVLDIGRPTLNGVDAARRIRKLAPQSKMLFVSQESSADVVQEAFRAGAWGYLVKMYAERELMSGCARGEKFIGRRFAVSRFHERGFPSPTPYS